MDVRFRHHDWEELADDRNVRSKLPPEIVTMYRRRLKQIKDAPHEGDFYAMRSYRFHRLEKERAGQYSIRLNDQWSLILEFEGEGQSKIAYVVEVTDYH